MADNVEIVERFLELRNRGGRAYLELLSPDAEFDLSESRGPHRGVYRGHQEIHGQWESLREAWTDGVLEPQDPIAVGDRVVVSIRVAARGRASEIELSGRAANLFRLEDGLITGLKLFQTRAEALAAAGAES